MMQPQSITTYVTQISEVADEFVKKMRTLRDPKTLELPDDFKNELCKWALECEFGIPDRGTFTPPMFYAPL